MATNITHKLNQNKIWYWYDSGTNKFLREISSQDNSFKVLPASIKAQIRQAEALKSQTNAHKSSADNQKWNNLNKYLKTKISGQDKVIDQWTKILSSHEFNAWKNPSAGLFLGGTGTGKTLLAQETNKFLNHDNQNFKRFDCNSPKLQNINNNERTIKELGDFVRNHPTGIILFDEFEKLHHAHNQVLSTALLNILDEGYLLDSDGKKIDCSKCAIIMTSNVASRQLASNDKMGAKQELSLYFPPEFLGRIAKSIFFFQPLSFETYINATKMMLNKEDGLFTKQLDLHKVVLNIDDTSIKNIILASVGAYHNMDDFANFDETLDANTPKSKEMKNLVAVHESGHAVVALAQMSAKDKESKNYPVKKITAIGEGNASGYTLTLPSEQNIPSETYLKSHLNELYAGRCAEKMFLPKEQVSTGWSNDKTRINHSITSLLLHFDPEFSQFVTEGKDFMKDIYPSFTDSQKELWSKKFKAIEQQYQTKTEQLLKDNEKTLKLFVEGQQIKGSLDQDEVAYIWDKQALPKSVVDFKKKSELDQTIAKIDNGSEPVSSKYGARGIAQWIINDMSFQIEELFNEGKIKPHSTVDLIVDKSGKVSVKDKAKIKDNKIEIER